MNKLDNTNYDIDLSDGVVTFKNINMTLVLLDIMRKLKLNISLLIQCLDVKDLLKNNYPLFFNNYFFKSTTKKFQLVSKYSNYLSRDEKQNNLRHKF